MTRCFAVIVACVACATALPAQTTGGPSRHPRVEGDWQAKQGDEIRHIMVRPDSSAQFGDQVARWRLVGDSLWLTLGDGVWMVYRVALATDKLTISGGDLKKPVTLKRVGPAVARADTVTVPAPPPDSERAWD